MPELRKATLEPRAVMRIGSCPSAASSRSRKTSSRASLAFIGTASFLTRVLHRNHVARLNPSTENQTVRRPVKTEQRLAVKMRHLVRRSPSERHAPDIVAVLSGTDISQFAAVRSPSNAGAVRSRNRSGQRERRLASVDADHRDTVRIVSGAQVLVPIEAGNPF